EGGAGRIEHARVPDRGAAAGGFPALQRGAGVVHLARGDAKAGDVDQQLLGGIAEGGSGGARPGARAGEVFGKRRPRSAQAYSWRRIRAASTIDCSLPTADSRGRNFMPQSGARITLSGGMNFSARLMRSTTTCGDSTFSSERSMQPTMIFLPGSLVSTE